MSGASARHATVEDLGDLTRLYGDLLTEMTALKPIWAATDGLPEPVDAALRSRFADPSVRVYLGLYEGAPVGFLMWRDDELFPQAGGARLGTILLIFTEPDARRVGVGEAMVGLFLEEAGSRGIRLFDAVVPPGHRHAKNFFESHGFKARRIVMHRDDRDGSA